ncbi:MAG: sigma-70 family RNA polymerase sigma factor [Firmicutes bacterium]|nr:sigma-70 family RNA polymerase sigma factor [Bacillota bacterium]
MPDHELESLVIAAKAVDRAASTSALEALLTRVYPRLLGYALKLTCNRCLAEEVCQETMVRAITGWRRYRPVRGRAGVSFQAWLFRIATNVYRDIRRKSARTASAGRPAPGGGGLAASAEDEAIHSIEREAMMEALAALPEEQRAVLVLRTYHDCSYREISEIVGCPEGTVKSRLHYAVLALREELRRRGVL